MPHSLQKFSLQYNTERKKREKLVEADWLQKQCWGCKEDSGLFILSSVWRMRAQPQFVL